MKTYRRFVETIVEISEREYELKASRDGSFSLTVWVWSENPDGSRFILRKGGYDRLTNASVTRLQKALGTAKSDDAWMINGEISDTVLVASFSR